MSKHSSKTQKTVQTYQDEEVWKDIPGWEGLYQASTWGRIKSLTRVLNFIRRGIPTAQTLSEHVMVPVVKRSGYCQVAFRRNPGGDKLFTYRIHRLIAIVFLPNPDNKPEVNHKNGVKTNNHVSNLEWATVQENHTHASIHGLTASRARNGNAKLSEDDVEKIIRWYASGMFTMAALGDMFEVHWYTIHRIIRKKNWK